MCYHDINDIIDMWEERHEDDNKFREQVIYYHRFVILIYGLYAVLVLLFLLYKIGSRPLKSL